MEHYDGPAFYRKFPVKPTPVKHEAPITEQAASQTKQRQRQHQTTNRPVPTSAATPIKTAQPTAPEASSAGSVSSYRPFQVTEVPKQLHWTHRQPSRRQRYQHLVQQLTKTDDSFLVLASAETPTPSVDDSSTTASLSVPASVPTEQITVSAATEVILPQSQTVTEKKTALTETISSSQSETSQASLTDQESMSSRHQTLWQDPEQIVDHEPAPTEIFYPEASLTTLEVVNHETSSASLDDRSAVLDEVTESLNSGSSVDEARRSESDEAAVAESEATDLQSSEDSMSATDRTAVAALSATSQVVSGIDSVTDVPTTPPADVYETPAPMDYLPVGSRPSEREGEAQATLTTSATMDTDVQRLLARADAADDELLTSDQPAPVEANEPTVNSVSDSAPAESSPVDSEDTPTNTTAEPEASAEAATSVESRPAPTVKSKPKVKRGLGHSLGDIMQEEGNEQRDLALFADAAPAPVTEVPTADVTPRGYHFPDLNLLPKPVVPDEAALDEWIEHQAEVLDATLSAFHVEAHVTDWTIGPTVTQFQVKLALGVKVSKITNLNDDLKLALAAKDIRIEAPIPGKTTVGIEIPNKKSRPVMLSEILNSGAFKKSESPLTVALGVDLFGQPQVTDLRKMPHGLIAGATGSGKSVFINSLLLSILYKANPRQVKLLLIDPKAVEMAPYDGLPHLLAPVISDPKAAAAALKWVVTEMDQRYEKLAAAGVRNIEQFNDRADANDEPGLKMPYIVIIIDELADLMMMAASEVQDYIVRITQKARAAGIHLLVATQRPSVDIVTGTIKNNIPTRIAFMVSSQIDSRTILDTTGAESLLGRGDMLYLGNGASQPMRLQGAFVEAEVDRVTDFVRTQGKPQYAFEPNGLLKQETDAENQDDLLPKVLDYIAQEKTVSTSKLQRVFSIGYNRAANLIDDLEQRNYVSPQHGSKPREVYLTPDDLGKDLPDPHDQDAPYSS